MDTAAPAGVTFGLDEASDTRPYGDNRTNLRTVRLVGHADPGAVVRLVQTRHDGDRRRGGPVRVLPGDAGDAGRPRVHGGGDGPGGQRRVVRADGDADRRAGGGPAAAGGDADAVGDEGQRRRRGDAHGDGERQRGRGRRWRCGSTARRCVLDGAGKATFVPGAAGVYTVVATARDAAGNTGEAGGEVFAVVAGRHDAAGGRFRFPNDTPTATLPIDVVGHGDGRAPGALHAGVLGEGPGRVGDVRDGDDGREQRRPRPVRPDAAGERLLRRAADGGGRQRQRDARRTRCSRRTGRRRSATSRCRSRT